MACVQRVRSNVNVSQAQETQLLPSVVTTEQQSLVVVKKLLAIAVSSITYLRGLFPEKAYGNKYVEEQKVMILREERSCPGANQIVQWMQGCFDAIQKKYLRTVVLSIYTDPENPQKVTEFYQFKILYTPKGPQMEFDRYILIQCECESEAHCNSTGKADTMSCTNIKKASILLVRKLYTLMQNLGPLPDSVCLNMKLSYYDDVTPQEYQPPGFKEGENDVIEFEKEPVKLTMGEVVTPFHTLKVDVFTEKERLEQVEEEEAVRVRDKWILKMEEETHVIEDVVKPDNDSLVLENTEIHLTCHETMNACEDSKMASLVKRTDDMEFALKRTRSGRVIRSTMEKKPVEEKTKKPSPAQKKMMSQFEFPNSQEVPSSSSAPKKRKFSEPKERY